MIRIAIHRFRATIIFTGVLAIALVANAAAPALPQSGTFTLTGSLNTARYDHAATLLQNGEVLVTEGLGVNGNYTSLASAKLYNPRNGKWTVTGSMSVGRTAFTATLLQNGEVNPRGRKIHEYCC